MDPTILSQIKFGIREVRAFVGHSFTEEDSEIVTRMTEFLTKLGVVCDSGKKPEPRAVHEKVLERIRVAELFVGVFTRRDQKQDGTYTTSSWVIEEKASAINMGKRLLLFVEDGVEKEIGGLQGDYEYVKFNRDDLADALIHAMDYVLAVTSIPFQCHVDLVGRKIDLKLGPSPLTLECQIEQLRKQKESEPNNIQLSVALARCLAQNGQRKQGIAELQEVIRNHPHDPNAYHELAHLLEVESDIDTAILNYQNALDRSTLEYKNYRCYGRCLYQKAKQISNKTARKSTLRKAKGLLQRAAVIGGERCKDEISADLFLLDEALAELE